MASLMKADPTPVCAGSPLRDARLKKRLSLREAATLARIDFAHLSRIERGQAQPSLDALYRLAVVLDMRHLRNALSPYLAEVERSYG